MSVIDQRLGELKIVSKYYKKCPYRACIKKSTNIIERLDQLNLWIAEHAQWLHSNRQRVYTNITIIKQYFESHGISIDDFRNNITKILEQKQKNNDDQIIKEIEIKRSTIYFPGGPKKNDDDDHDKSQTKIEISQDDAPHMFEDRPGHLPDTPKNRQLLIDLVSNKQNFLNLDRYGTEWYAKIISDGKQLWAVVRNGLIRNGGLNDVPKTFNYKTGLSRLFKP